MKKCNGFWHNADFIGFRPDKLLFHLGNERRSEGSADGEFSWPRGLAVSTSGEIYVADTANHRIQSINAFGVLTKMFGKLGTGDGEFNQPTGKFNTTHKFEYNAVADWFQL